MELPKNQDPIVTDWHGKGGGIRVFSYTDKEGAPTFAITGFNERYRATTATRFVQATEYQDVITHRYTGKIFKVLYHLKATAKDVVLFVHPHQAIDLSHHDDDRNIICTAWGTPLSKPKLIYAAKPDIPLAYVMDQHQRMAKLLPEEGS